jgi:hypothetical protein
MRDDHAAAEAEAALVSSAVRRLNAEATTPVPLGLDARILLRRAGIMRQGGEEKRALAPISVGLPCAVAVDALAAAIALSKWAPATAAGAIAQFTFQALLWGAMLAACASAAAAWLDLRAGTTRKTGVLR